jgi:CRISPR-associated protein Cmr6
MPQDKQRPPMKQGSQDPSQPATVFPLPKDTTGVARAPGIKCQNLGLWLDRFILYEQRGNRLEQSRQSRKREAAPLNFQSINPLLTACRKRWEAVLQSYEPDVTRFTATPEWRVAIGLGAEHALETNLTLHRIYGTPFIPGSAVKGVTRAQAFWNIATKLELPEESLGDFDQLLSEADEKAQETRWKRIGGDRDFAVWQEASADFYTIFGTTEARGKVTFFDAYPTQAPKLKLDIMNPHYAPYYSDAKKRTPPGDYHSPVPVYFLTVERTPFSFALASSDSHLRDTAEAWLRAALSDLGIGSKTAAGYGFMEPAPSKPIR